MTWKRGFAISILVLAVASTRIGTRAQDTPPEPPPSPPASPSPAAPPPATAEPAGPGFWGDHFALYIEGGGGVGSIDTLDSSVETSSSLQSLNAMDISDVLNARIAVGWKLPLERGSFRIVFTGQSEDAYEFTATGLNRAVGNSNTLPAALQPWWHVNVNDGTLTSTLIPPTWVDTDGDHVIDNNEVQLIPGSGPPSGVRTVPDNAQNRLQIWDFLFLRDFGGKIWSGDYSCGLRYLIYDGNVPAAAWLNTSDSTSNSGGYTDGTNLRLLGLNQESSGFGPTGSLGLQWHLFRNRLTLYAEARFAFILQDMKVDSGTFFTLVTVSESGTTAEFTQTVPARLEQEVSKSTWNFGGAFGARFRVADGFNVNLAYDRTAYQDSVLLPFAITIPSSAEVAPFGTVGLYRTQDIKIDSLRFTLGFQF